MRSRAKESAEALEPSSELYRKGSTGETRQHVHESKRNFSLYNSHLPSPVHSASLVRISIHYSRLERHIHP